MTHRRWIPLAPLLTVALLAALAPLATCARRPSSSSDDFAVRVAVTPGQLEAQLLATLTASPDEREARLALADLYAHTDRIAQAIPLFEALLQDRPDDLTVRLSYAQALLQHGFLADAEAQLQRALQVDPENSQVLYLLGQIAERRNPPDLDAARTWYQRAARSADDPYARLARQRLEQLAHP